MTPKDDEHLYVSRKGGHSLNILAICNADMKYTYVVAKYPGSTNDAFIWLNCNLQQSIEHGEMGDGWLLGDSGFALDRHLLTPILRPQNHAEEHYNSAHRRTRQIIERAFGVTKQRFRCMHRTGGEMTYAPVKCCKIIVVCMILHNMCMDANLPLNEDDSDGDDDDDEHDMIGDIVMGDHDNEAAGRNRRQNNDGVYVRRRLIEHRFTEA